MLILRFVNTVNFLIISVVPAVGIYSVFDNRRGPFDEGTDNLSCDTKEVIPVVLCCIFNFLPGNAVKKRKLNLIINPTP